MFTYVKTPCIILKLRRGTKLEKVCINNNKISKYALPTTTTK